MLLGIADDNILKNATHYIYIVYFSVCKYRAFFVSAYQVSVFFLSFFDFFLSSTPPRGFRQSLIKVGQGHGVFREAAAMVWSAFQDFRQIVT